MNSHVAMSLPCGRCTGCRLERSRVWALRCVHEAQLHDENCFITLTYDNANLPADYSVHVRTWQLFMKRLRKSLGSEKIRSFACGEYGDESGRPHYHAIIFGHNFPDKLFYKRTSIGEQLFTSQKLFEVWPYGQSLVGSMTFQSAAYIARYIMKKYTNPDPRLVDRYYTRIHPVTLKEVRVQPEFVTQSRRPGLGAGWFKKFKSDVYPHDYVVINGAKMRPPRFYDLQLSEEELADLKRHRQMSSVGKNWNRKPDRLRVRAIVRDARIKSLKRDL